mgnify:FL=1|jgi:glycosyltransferase involved in cell wall biosynthesis
MDGMPIGAMFEGWNVGVVIPARNEVDHIKDVIEDLPEWVDRIVVIDDGSSDGTGKAAEGATVIRLEGEGVGAAIDTGHRDMLENLEDPFISVVMAGDGQMDVDDLEAVIEPIISGNVHHVKGDRSAHSTGLAKMPMLRRIGSAILAFLTTLACGRKINDPQCGYTATSYLILRYWDWNKSWKGYGYPNWWLMELTRKKYAIAQVPVVAIYDGQKSGLSIPSFLVKVAPMLLIGLHKRAFSWLQADMVTLESALGIPAAMFYAAGWAGIALAILTVGEDFEMFVFLTVICWAIAHFIDRKWVAQKVTSRS